MSKVRASKNDSSSEPKRTRRKSNKVETSKNDASMIENTFSSTTDTEFQSTDVESESIEPKITKNIILSIDIGMKNLGITSVVYSSDVVDLTTSDVVFYNYNLANLSTITDRCKRLRAILNQLIGNYICTKIIIEKQFNNNTIAMCLMYALTSIGQEICINDGDLVVFAPDQKFRYINEKYETRNRKHKKKSVDHALKFISTHLQDKIDDFNRIHKKDDIADSLNQLIIQLIMWNKLRINENLYTRNDLMNLFEIPIEGAEE
jgi:Holliday junction resolvasome RuvABC endonuclease subunit